ncbi:hypothetical protein N9K82_04815 [Gammaproteobacteria bacterium]|nr:hypothetical protein [Gammaproteobacteria bacterium]
MANYSRTMDFLHQKLLQARTKDQEDKIVNWMLAEAQSKQSLKNKHSLINSSSQKNSDLHLQKK